MAASARFRASMRQSAAERNELLALTEEARRLQVARAERARRARLARQKIARYEYVASSSYSTSCHKWMRSTAVDSQVAVEDERVFLPPVGPIRELRELLVLLSVLT